jgi:hypothetical protein
MPKGAIRNGAVAWVTEIRLILKHEQFTAVINVLTRSKDFDSQWTERLRSFRCDKGHEHYLEYLIFVSTHWLLRTLCGC